MKISSITIKGMHKIKKKTYTFNDLNYLFGSNGAGKSTVLQAIQLAILGYIPGTEKNKTAIFNHSNGKSMEVTIMFDDGSGIERSWEMDKTLTASVRCIGEIEEPDAIMQNLDLPIYDFSEFMNLSANKLKDWFVNFLPTDAYTVDWNTELYAAVKHLGVKPEDVELIAKNVTANIGSDLNSVRKFNEVCKDTVSSKKGELNRVQSTIQSLIHYDDCDPTLNANQIKQDISNAEIVLDNLKAKQAKYEQYLRAKAILDDTKDILDGYDDINDNEAYIGICDIINNSNKMVDMIDEQISKLQSSCNTLNTTIGINQGIIDKQGVCPFTSRSCAEIQSLISSLKEKVEVYKQTCEHYNKQIQTLQAQKQTTLNSIQSSTRTKNNIEQAYNKYNSVKEFLDSTFDNVTKDSIQSEIMTKSMELATLRSKLVEIEANARYEALTDKLTAEKIKLELDLEMYKVWEKLTGVNGLQTKIANQPFADFSNNITEYLHKFYNTIDISADFCLIEKANSFSFGLKRDNKYIPYELLSSGEKCMYMFSLILAINDSSKSDLKLVLVDDLLDHLDSNNIYNTFITLYNSTSSQIIIAGVQPYNYENKDDIVIEIGD